MTELRVYLDREKDEKKFKALIALFEAFDLEYKIDEDFVLNDEQKQEVLRREEEYMSGRMKLYTIEEVKEHLGVTR